MKDSNMFQCAVVTVGHQGFDTEKVQILRFSRIPVALKVHNFLSLPLNI